MPHSRLFNAWVVYGMMTLGVVLCAAIVWLVVGVSDRKPAAMLFGCALITTSRIAAWSTLRELVLRAPGAAPFANNPRSGLAASAIDLALTAIGLAASWLVGEIVPVSVLAQVAGVAAGAVVLFGTPSPIVLRRRAPT